MELYGNNAATTLNGGISSGATSLVVTSATNFPTTGNFRILVDSGANLEYMLVTSVTGGTTFNVTRGIENTTGVAHLTGVQVVAVLTVGGLQNLLASPARLLAYDANDLVAYRLNDSASPLVNGGSAGSSANLTVVNNLQFNASTSFGPALYEEGGIISGTRDYTTGGAGVEPTTAVTMSCWIYLLSYNSPNNWNIFSKTYRPVGSWTPPFQSFAIYGFNSSPQGQWWVLVTTGTTGSGTAKTITASLKNYLRLYEWQHVGLTWDSATNLLLMYMNGVQIGSLATSGALDNNANTGYYLFGATPDSGSNEQTNMMILDARVATIARPASYFATAYQTGLRLQPG